MSRPTANCPGECFVLVLTVVRIAQAILWRILSNSSRQTSPGSMTKSSLRSISPIVRCTLSAKALVCGFLTVVGMPVIP